jgi:hypothetical protein
MEKLSRKKFLKNIFFSGAVILGGSTLLAACGGGEKKPEGNENTSQQSNVNDPCSDVSNLSDAELATRKQFNYTGQTTDSDKYCSNCLHWVPSTGNGPCGTCELVKGPINPNGYCDQYMKKPKTVG